MGRSWNHSVRPLTTDELERLECQNARGAQIFEREDYDYDITCRMPKCRQQATHAVRYSYVTGRAGRVSWAEKNVCIGHAEKFAAKHDVEIIAAPKPEHALQRMLQAGGLGEAAQ